MLHVLVWGWDLRCRPVYAVAGCCSCAEVNWKKYQFRMLKRLDSQEHLLQLEILSSDSRVQTVQWDPGKMHTGCRSVAMCVAWMLQVFVPEVAGRSDQIRFRWSDRIHSSTGFCLPSPCAFFSVVMASSTWHCLLTRLTLTCEERPARARRVCLWQRNTYYTLCELTCADGVHLHKH